MSEETTNIPPAEETKQEDIFTQRLNKVKELEAAGKLPFGRRFDNVIKTAEVREQYKPEQENQPEFTIAGRMTAFRAMGKSIFADVKDSSGRMQIYVQRGTVSDDEFAAFKKLDLGDIIGVTGILFTTRTGELTLKAHKVTLLTKSLRPLPEAERLSRTALYFNRTSLIPDPDQFPQSPLTIARRRYRIFK